ncbi:hypothetical protein D3C72_1595030 [compost metagenome]
MGLRQRHQSRRRGNKGLPARTLHGKDDGAQRGLEAVALPVRWRLLRRGVVAGGGKSMHANGSTTGLDGKGAATAAGSPEQAAARWQPLYAGQSG